MGSRVCTRCGAVLASSIEICPLCYPDRAELPRDPLVGRVASERYQIQERLARGGMSSVYLAKDMLTDRSVVVKTLRRDLAMDPMQRSRFLREARAVNRAHHPGIIEILDFGETEDGLVFLVMEYLPGRSLHALMAEAPFSVMFILDVAEQVAGALASAHHEGVIHRDLKPENILFIENGYNYKVKVLDFGIAKILDAPILTGSQQLFGTPGYIAPEYVQFGHLDGRSDLYSLGVVMYEMATGKLPFDYEYPGDLLLKHCLDAPNKMHIHHVVVPEIFEDFVMKALAKNPEDRFRDANEFLRELRAIRSQIHSHLPPNHQDASVIQIASRRVRTIPPTVSLLSDSLVIDERVEKA